MSRPQLHLALPCPRCSAEAGQPCLSITTGQPCKRPHVRRTPDAPCGTHGGYVRHFKRGEKPCAGCTEAHRRYMAEYRRKKPEYREAGIALLRARREATRLLIEAHREEFERLLSEVRP